MPKSTKRVAHQFDVATSRFFKNDNHRVKQNSLRPKLLAFAVAQAIAAPAMAGIITVNDAGDSGGLNDCTLRQAVVSANNDNAGSSNCAAGSGADTIKFSPGVVEMGTITLSTASAITTTNNVYITGPVLDTLIVDGGGNAGVFSAGSERTTISNLTITGGSAAEGAGVVAFGNRLVTLENCTVTGNTATSFGGGVAARYNSTISLKNSTVSGNSSGNLAGGVFAITDASVQLYNSTVSDNSAAFRGGGVWVSSSEASIRNSTITGNSSADGGGVFIYDSAFLITNALVSGNLAGTGPNDDGAEVYVSAFGTSSVITATFNLLGESSNTNAPAFQNFTVAGSNIGATSDGALPTALPSILAPLADNGGASFTHALVVNSPALSAANGSGCTQSPVLKKDQRGFPRNSVCDIGAYEAQTPATITVSSSLSGTGDCTLRDAIESSNTDTAVGGCVAGNNNDTIVFDGAVFSPEASTTITLANALPTLTSHTSITGPGKDQLIIDANGTGRVLALNGADVSLTGLTLTSGYVGAAIDGAGIRAQESSLSISDASISGNTATTGVGGGINATIYTSITLANVEISDNTAGIGGGISLRSRSKGTVSNSTISNNASTNSAGMAGRGGGVYVSNSSFLELSNSTVSGNSAYNEGGGISVFDGQATIINSTISANTSGTIGGGILLRAYGDLNLTNSIVNSIVAGNMGGVSQRSYEIFNGVYSSLTTQFNLLGNASNTNYISFSDNFMRDVTDITATSDGTAPTDLAAILLPLADNDGATFTHELPEGSPAIDAGDNAVCEGAPIFNLDQRGESRPQARSCDIGSFEAEEPGQFFVVPLPNGRPVIFSL